MRKFEWKKIMVTNINLVSPESESKSMLTGKATLFFSITLVVLSLVVFGVINYLGKNYASKKASLEGEIQSEKAKLGGPNYMALADFQERNDLLGEIIDDHSYYDEYFKELSRYILPEIRIIDISGGEDEGGLSMKGATSNFETLSRGIILLQKFPGVNSVEFKNASEKSSTDGSQTGIEFELTAKINKDSLKRNASGAN